MHGGVAQGIGQALYEGVAYDAEGQLLTASYQDYCVPRADDIPPISVTLDDSAPCRTNPLGAKGCGESGAIGGPPCVANGVMDALSELGIKQLNTPLTPQKVWKAIQDATAANGKEVERRRRSGTVLLNQQLRSAMTIQPDLIAFLAWSTDRGGR